MRAASFPELVPSGSGYVVLGLRRRSTPAIAVAQYMGGSGEASTRHRQ
jgi:hypothetical protein